MRGLRRVAEWDEDCGEEDGARGWMGLGAGRWSGGGRELGAWREREGRGQ